MDRRSDIGTAVIGSGFIGTVHIEALRRIGVNVVGLLGSSRRARPRSGPAQLGVAARLRGPRRAARRHRVDVVHVTRPNELHHPQVKAILAAGRHVVCEKPLAMTSAESGELVGLAGASGLVNAVNFNIRFYPLNQHVRGARRATAGVGDVRLVTGRYFQDWLLFDTDWNWRLEPERGGALRAVGDIGSHWLDLTTFLTGRHVEAVMADLDDVHPRPPPADRPGRDVLDRARRRHRPGRDPDRGRRDDPAAVRGRGARLGRHLASSAPAARTACSTRSTAAPPPSRGIRSSRSSCGSVIATGPTSCCSGTPRS